MMKRYLITTAVILVVVSGFSTWRVNCHSGCSFEQVALGLPVFFTTPYLPTSDQRPEFSLFPLLINIVWTAAVSVSFWAVVDTAERWQDRRRQPPFV